LGLSLDTRVLFSFYEKQHLICTDQNVSATGVSSGLADPTTVLVWGGVGSAEPTLWLKGEKFQVAVKKRAETHSAHASTVLLAVYKRRSSSHP